MFAPEKSGEAENGAGVDISPHIEGEERNRRRFRSRSKARARRGCEGHPHSAPQEEGRDLTCLDLEPSPGAGETRLQNMTRRGNGGPPQVRWLSIDTSRFGAPR